MPELKDENKQMFTEQVQDHIQKLVNMLEHSSGENVDSDVIDRLCLATRLLEGSAGMLELDRWSEILTLFREMIEHSCGRRWDENLSQVVSEIIEAEEKVIEKVEAGGIGSDSDMNLFDGIKNEILFLTSEYESAEPEEDDSSDVQVVYFKESNNENCFEIIDSMVNVLDQMKQKLILCREDDNRSDSEDLQNFYGESRFYMEIVGNLVRRVADPEGRMYASVSSQILLTAIREITDIYRDMKGWSMTFEPRTDDFIMDSDMGSSFFSIIENCLFDINALSLKSGDQDLNMELDITRKGSYLETVIRDNCLSNSVIENVDIAAYYQGLISTRNILKKWRGLLWVERGVEKGERFKFTLPLNRRRTDYRIFRVSGMEVGIPSRCIEEVREFSEHNVTIENDRYYTNSGGSKVPVFGMDELAPEQIDAGYDYNYLTVFGIAEERIAVLCENEGYRIETVQEQAVEESQLSVSRISLQIGDDSFPVLDTPMILERIDDLQGKDLSYAAPVSSADTGIA